MYLQEIVINGFKSFGDRTQMELEPGVIAIVGPNGCGKSNIADAIRWVLGEQSAKALRGGKMQDIIFEGSESRKAHNLCEVYLRFTNCEKQLGTQFHEVEIGRRVSRDGQSEYLLNGKSCRLKDVQRLFMDTGIGRVSYSFLVQGQIDQILSSNPAERRVIFEEAAGITRYKAQRRETMNKLTLVENNLARVTDVIDEVSRQIGSLKRQASKALRYQRLNHRLTHLDLAQQAREYVTLQGEIKELESLAEGIRGEVEAARKRSSEQELTLEGERERRSRLYQQLQDAQQRVYALRSEQENAENRAEFAGVRRDDLSSRLAELEGEIRDLDEQRTHMARKAADDAQVKQLQLDLVGSSDQAFQDKNRELFESQERLTSTENELQEARQRLLMQESALTRERSRMTSIEVDLRTYQVKHAGLRDQMKELEDRRAELERGREEILKARARVEIARTQVTEEMGKTREAADTLRGRFRGIQGSIQERDRESARLSARMQVLENLNASLEGFGGGARAILQDSLSELIPAEGRKLLAAGIQLQDDAFAAALDALLSTARDAIHVADVPTALAVIEALEEKKLGRACLGIPVPGGNPGTVEPPVDGLPEGLIPAFSRMTVGDSSVREAMDHLLAGCYFCEGLEAFVDYWMEHPEFRFNRVATLRGEVVDARGLIFGGHEKGGQASFLQRQADIRSLKKQIASIEREMVKLRLEAEAVEAELDEKEKRLEQQRDRLNEVNQEHSTLAAQEKSGQDGLLDIQTRSENAVRQMERMEEEHRERERGMVEAKERLEQTERDLEEHRKAIETVEAKVRAARDERDARREGLSDVRLQLAEKKQRLETIDRSLRSLEDQSNELQERILRRRQEMDGIHEQIAERAEEQEREKARAAAVAETLLVTRDQLEKDRAAFSEAEQKVAELEKVLSRLRDAEREKDGQLNRWEVRLAELRSKHSFLSERVRSEYQVEIGEVDWMKELWKAGEEFERRLDLDSLEEGETPEARPKRPRGEPDAEALQSMEQTDWEALAAEVRELKERILAMGPVNLVAIDEYSDLSQRFKFLKEQSEDLWESKNTLIAAIDEINSISMQLFADTFEQIRKNFQFAYEQLTAGGFADLALVDREDVLDSGIEIIARPPGTRLKSISLLSGGQRTMTAVALLFAIYMVKPSPFCVLDELDAPLDDANIGRFTQMLKRFTEYSQFLIITHNKRTIASADAIFGVTMPEKGVSRMVSMRFNHEIGKAEAVDADSAAAPVQAG